LVAKTARAFSPAGISSFFEICDTTPDGKPITQTEFVGSRGGGFVIEKGVLTEISAKESKESRIEIYINSRPAPDAETTRTVAATLLDKVGNPYEVAIHHRVAVPIGAGFGSSAAGALSTALALSKALGINLTLFQAGRVAHVAEVKCRTGLGTVGPVALGGCVVTVEPGALGCGIIDQIPTTPEHRIVTGYYRPIPTKKVLASDKIRRRVNRCGRETVDRILVDPSLENFMHASKEFTKNAGFMTPVTEKLIDLAEKAGAIGAAQNMVGEAVHALTTVSNAQEIVEVFKRVLPPRNILTARIDVRGARLLG
jgi:pantoate kinase